MQPVLSAKAMREADRVTIEEVGIPGFTLMESAGRAAAAAIQGAFPASRVGVLCGRGNNGGDGLVVARALANAGCNVRVFFPEGTDRLSPDAQQNLDILGHPAFSRAEVVDALSELEDCQVLVDGLLGTGITSAPRPPVDGVIDWMNGRRSPRVALDLPSGVNADNGQTSGSAVQADLTVTFGALKAGLLLGQGAALAGRVVVAPIGIPEAVLAAGADEAGCGFLADDAFVQATIPRRPLGAHKYTTGPSLIVGGSAKYPGAPVLAASAAARVGSGYVVAGLAEGVAWAGPAEIPSFPFGAGETLQDWTSRARAVLVGPGLGQGDGARQVVADVCAMASGPVVIDADGLRALDGPGSLPDGDYLLTPHLGEFAHLTGKKDFDNPIEAARDFARDWGVSVILKGAPSVVADPSGRVVVCALSGTTFATAGTGDVLAGLCVGLLAMGLPTGDAAICAAQIGGRAAEQFARSRSSDSMMASDIVQQVPVVLSERFGR